MVSDTHKYAPVTVPVIGGGMGTPGESFIAMPVDSPSQEAHPYLEVVSPATLPEGYTFEAESNGHAFRVKVPVGGVEEGQKFSVPFPAGANGYSGSAVPRASVPVGAWRDGLCDCFSHGLIHPMLWNACYCRLILIGQVMHRLKLTWLGNESTNAAQSKATFRICLSIALVYFFINNIFFYHAMATLFAFDEDGQLKDTDDDWGIVHSWLGFFLAIFMVILVTKTRKHVRLKYGIPEAGCAGCEDFCCSLWCNCCTVAQLARHTADYSTYAGLCCSETGVPKHAPSIV
jgi:Cys-rich protein (TIGR01571 family)